MSVKKLEYIEFRCPDCGTPFLDVKKETGVYFCPECCAEVTRDDTMDLCGSKRSQNSFNLFDLE